MGNVCSAAAMRPVREMLERTSKARQSSKRGAKKANKSAAIATTPSTSEHGAPPVPPSDTSDVTPSAPLALQDENKSDATNAGTPLISASPYLDSHGRLRRDEIIHDFDRIRSGEDTSTPKLCIMNMNDFVQAISHVGPT